MTFEELIGNVQLSEQPGNTGTACYAEYKNKYYEISPLMGRLIELAKAKGADNKNLAEALSRSANIPVTDVNVETIKSNFVKSITGKPVRSLDGIRFKINLVKPALLAKLTHPLKFFYHPGIMAFLIITSCSLVAAVLLNYKGGNIFTGIATQFNPQTLVFATALHTFIILFHELGHATAAARQKLPPGSIGFGIYFFTPVFYANTTHAWKIESRKRLLVDCGGIYFQLIALIPLSLFYLQQNSQVMLYLIIVNILTIIANLNPLLKYDGYWIFADLLNLNNLRSKTSSVTRYYILKYLFFRKPEEPADIKKIKPGIKKFLLGYTVFANLLFLYFFCFFIPRIMVTLVRNEIFIAKKIFQTSANNLFSFFSSHGTDLVNLLLNILILLFLARTTIRFFYGIILFLKNNLFTHSKQTT
jgi:hypothetical protein